MANRLDDIEKFVLEEEWDVEGTILLTADEEQEEEEEEATIL